MRSSRRRSRPGSARALSRRRCPTPSSRSSSASCRPTSCPSNDRPERSTHDRAPDPDRPPASRTTTSSRRASTCCRTPRSPARTWPARRASRPATRSRPGRSRRASRSASTTRSSASRARTSRPASTSTPTTSRCATSPATTPSARMRKPTAYRAGGPSGASFEGFLRANGKAGTRNFIGVLSTVNCSATVCHHIAETFPKDELAQYRQRRRHRRADPRHRLRHGRSRRGLRHPAAHALGLCRAIPTSPAC